MTATGWERASGTTHGVPVVSAGYRSPEKGGQVRRLLTLTGVDTVIEVYPSVSEALAGHPAPGRAD